MNKKLEGEKVVRWTINKQKSSFSNPKWTTEWQNNIQKEKRKGFTKLKKCKLSYLIFESQPTNGWKENSNKKINRRCEKNQQEYTYHCWMPFIEDRNSNSDVFGNFLRLWLGQFHHHFSIISNKFFGVVLEDPFLKGFEPKLYFIMGPSLLFFVLQMQNTSCFFLIRKFVFVNQFFDFFPGQLNRLWSGVCFRALFWGWWLFLVRF